MSQSFEIIAKKCYLAEQNDNVFKWYLILFQFQCFFSGINFKEKNKF